MLMQRFALFAPEGEPGSGAAGGESSDEGGSGEKDVVPVSRLTAALANQERKHAEALATLRSEMEAKLTEATKPKVEAPKEYTRAELNAMVEAGQINQAQADTQIELQTIAKAEASAARVARETVQQATRTESVSSQIAAYKDLVPELADRGSDIFQKVKTEFSFLLSLGNKPTLETELQAIRAVHGPIESVRAAKSGRRSTESHAESGGSGGEAGPKGGKGTLKLTEREEAHYRSKVGPGKMYPDWKAVEEELKFARPDVRARNGARV